ncbi:sugar ABC transporter ATP-binding protein [Spiroplasma sp. SV19]|uniref:sugar ABC transporter ATP-binding protein n=1 Tax=Spiroplasma sp. SV19 TaxID=2570468 RepID=UPI0024B77D09|nr:sugar ABC transporter ATP-binding protein [Spiroplasma sp. SV19]WHQ36340.1 ATP-binding cassette domain-containing protein [Spiroplasma sp. SV19]
MNYNQKPILELKHITKIFGNTKALEQVSLQIFGGEVLGIIGENGAGKSTLMKIISGVYKKTIGEYYFNGTLVNFHNIKEAEKNGIIIIHQELMLVPEMNILDNIFLGHEIRYPWGAINYSEQIKKALVVFKFLNLTIDYHEKIKNISIAEQQMVEIAKALLKQANVIIMDEPTSSLSEKEVNALFKVIAKLRDEGKAILYISHRLEEIPKICDRITILRDGKVINSYLISTFNEQQMIKDMVGREITEQYPTKIKLPLIKPIFTVNNFNTSKLKNISFTINQYEILGFAGLVGAQRSELFKALIGYGDKGKGQILFNNKTCKFKNPVSAIKHLFYYVTENRKTEGLFLDFTVKNNISISALSKITNRYGCYLESTKETKTIQTLITKMKIKVTGLKQLVKTLSGGNQQKVLIAKALMATPVVLILDEPTRGIDVGARKEIYNLIYQLKQQGVAVVIISSDLPEIVGLCDRVIVMAQGQIMSELTNDNITQEQIMQKAIL